MSGKIAPKKILEIEAVRGAASLYVVLHHMTVLVTPFIPKLMLAPFLFGQEAVIIFFLLSGYVINRSWLRRPDISLGAYFWARWSRIYPILVVAIIVTTVCVLLSGEPIEAGSAFKQAAGNLLLLQDRQGVVHIVPAYLNNTPLWSLSYEWFFYFLFFFVSRLSGNRLYTVGCLISLVAAAIYFPTLNPICRFIMYWPIWLLGATYADEGSAHRSRLVVLCTLGVIAAMSLSQSYQAFMGGAKIDFSGDPFLQTRHLVFALAIVPLMAFVMRVYQLVQSLKLVQASVSLLASVGAISYSLYVLHYPVLILITQNMEAPYRIISLIGLVPVLLLCTYLSEYVIQPWVNTFRLSARTRPA